MGKRAECEHRVVVVGGNISGLAAALALRDRGIPVALIERAPTQPRVNGGLHIWTNGTRAMHRLGVHDAIRAEGEPVERLQFRTWDGRVLMSIPVGEYARRWGFGAFFVPRDDVPRTLLEALGDGVVRWGAQCVGVHQDPTGVTLELADRTEERAAVLVGADGINSTVRRAVLGDVLPREAGYEDWGALLEYDDSRFPRGEFWTLWGPGARFGMAHIGRGRVYWAASIDREGGNPPTIDELRERFRGWQAPVEDLIAATPPDRFYGAAIRDIAPMSSWGVHRVTLAGDAAHATTPNAGRGASEALEDAFVLADALADAGDLAHGPAVEAALRRYEQLRMKPTKQVTKLSWQIARLGRWQAPLACSAREVYIRSIARPTARSMRRDFQAGGPPPALPETE